MVDLPTNGPLTLPLGCVVSPSTPVPCRYDLVPVTTRPVAQHRPCSYFDGSQRTRVTSGIARLPVLLFFLSRLLSGVRSHEERS
jgi:hypothetical protein